ncbi:hypothetical protein [Oceaniferula spumae]
MLIFLVRGLPQLEVYHTATPYKVTLRAITTDGTAELLELPDELRGVHRKKVILEKIQRFSQSEEANHLTPHGGKLEWTLRYSKDSLRYDQERKIITNHSAEEVSR